jgi:hypothetical protein
MSSWNEGKYIHRLLFVNTRQHKKYLLALLPTP